MPATLLSLCMPRPCTHLILCSWLCTCPQADKESLLSALTAMEDWLYDEGEDCGKSVYVAKLDELKKTGDPIEMRWAVAGPRGGQWRGGGSGLH